MLLLKDSSHELALLVGLVIDWGSTGAFAIPGLPRPTACSLRPFYFGKGFGDLPDAAGWLRAFAVTGQIGYQVPSRSFDVVDGSFIPQVLAWGGSIQYSMPYLKSEILDLQLPDFINHLIPIVEFQMSTPAANNFGNSFVTTGTVNPGVSGRATISRSGWEAQVPVNRQSGHGIGVLGRNSTLSRRHVPEDYRPAAHRRYVEPAATDQVLRYAMRKPPS